MNKSISNSSACEGRGINVTVRNEIRLWLESFLCGKYVYYIKIKLLICEAFY